MSVSASKVPGATGREGCGQGVAERRPVGYPLPVFVGGRRLVLGSCLAALLAGAAGCSGSGSGPRSLPPLSTTPAARATTPPAVSEKAELQQATAVVREYFRLLNTRTSTRTERALSLLMTSDCTCQRVVKSIGEVLRKNQHYYGRNRVVSVTPALDGAQDADALVEYDYTDSGIKDSRGQVVTNTAGRRGTLLSFQLTRRGDKWLIRQVITVRKGRPA
jgi:hypothetical protein